MQSPTVFTWASNIDSSTIFLNPTDNAVLQNLQGFQWKDLDGNIVNSLNLQPWTSKVMIKTNIAILPVSILSFSATKKYDDVICSWITANEINLSHFIVERSVDGKNFNAVGTVIATNSNSYSFADANISFTQSNFLYYRLLLVDKDGKSSYSSIATIKIADKNAITIYPNPASNFVNVSGANIKNIVLYNAHGQLIQSFITSEKNTVLNLSTLTKGVYVIKVENIDGELISKQIFVQ